MSSGHWEVEKSGKFYYCSVSGGYVMIGIRVNSKISFEIINSENTPIESYANASLRVFIKQNLGEKILEEVDKKVKYLMENKNKATSGPGKEN